MIRKAGPEDAAALTALTIELWPENTASELQEELQALLQRLDAVCFLLVIDGSAQGFAQCQLRYDYVEGTESSPVGYLEGILVKEPYRKRGCGAALLRKCEAWAREKGCTEFASDCELENEESAAFHRAVGFREANRIVCFQKKL